MPAFSTAARRMAFLCARQIQIVGLKARDAGFRAGVDMDGNEEISLFSYRDVRAFAQGYPVVLAAGEHDIVTGGAQYRTEPFGDIQRQFPFHDIVVRSAGVLAAVPGVDDDGLDAQPELFGPRSAEPSARGAEAVRVFPAEEEEEDSATEMPPVSALEDAVASTTMRNGDFSVLTV